MVAELGIQAIKGYQSRGIAAVAKHFPGMVIPRSILTRGCPGSVIPCPA